MKRFILAVAALVASATALFADVKDGDTFRLAGRSVTYNVSVLPGFNVAEVSVTDASGTSSTYNGTPGEGGGNTASETPTMKTPGGTEYRVNDCRAERKNASGQWINLGRPRKNSIGPAPEEEELLDVPEERLVPSPEEAEEGTLGGGGVLGSEDSDTTPVTERPAPRP